MENSEQMPKWAENVIETMLKNQATLTEEVTKLKAELYDLQQGQGKKKEDNEAPEPSKEMVDKVFKQINF